MQEEKERCETILKTIEGYFIRVTVGEERIMTETNEVRFGDKAVSFDDQWAVATQTV